VLFRSKRRNELLKKYKTTTKLKELSKEELEEILPSKVAENLIEFLSNY
jgi:excinuclease UvrABC nuclease subunit